MFHKTLLLLILLGSLAMAEDKQKPLFDFSKPDAVEAWQAAPVHGGLPAAVLRGVGRQIAPLLVSPDYQRLWGWQDRVPAATVSPPRPVSPGPSFPPQYSITGSTASGVDPKPNQLPPTSGEKFV